MEITFKTVLQAIALVAAIQFILISTIIIFGG